MKTKDIRYLKAKSLRNQPKTIYRFIFMAKWKYLYHEEITEKQFQIFKIYYDVIVQLN